MFKWVFFLIGGSWGNLKCLGRMIRSLYNKNQDPELDCCVGELYRMSMVCFLRTTLTPPGRFSVSPFLKDNCTSDFPNWAFNLKGKNPLFRLRKLVSYKYNASFHFNLLYSDIILRLGISSWTYTLHYFYIKFLHIWKLTLTMVLCGSPVRCLLCFWWQGKLWIQVQ